MQQKLSRENILTTNFGIIWAPIILIVFITLVFLFIIFICYNVINKKARTYVYANTSNTENENFGALNNGVENFPTAEPEEPSTPKRKWFVKLFIVLYIFYSLLFTCSLTFGILYFAHTSVWSSISNPENLGKELQEHVNNSLNDIHKFEKAERDRIFQKFVERREACLYHLKSENKRLLVDYEDTTRRQIDTIFSENGTLHHLTSKVGN